MGLRELKKEQTRQLIADTAWRLFAERGFDRVTVAEVAREAQVAQATVFNYFATKEDLFYSRLEAFGTRLTEAIAARDPGETVLAAFRHFLQEAGGLLAEAESGDPEAVARLRAMNRVISGSPALLAREQQAMARIEDSLAALLAAETGAPPGDITPQVAANALMGAHRAILDYVRRRVLADEELPRLAADVKTLTTAAFALLERGLGGYGTKPPGPPLRPAPRSAEPPHMPAPAVPVTKEHGWPDHAPA